MVLVGYPSLSINSHSSHEKPESHHPPAIRLVFQLQNVHSSIHIVNLYPFGVLEGYTPFAFSLTDFTHFQVTEVKTFSSHCLPEVVVYICNMVRFFFGHNLSSLLGSSNFLNLNLHILRFILCVEWFWVVMNAWCHVVEGGHQEDVTTCWPESWTQETRGSLSPPLPLEYAFCLLFPIPEAAPRILPEIIMSYWDCLDGICD